MKLLEMFAGLTEAELRADEPMSAHTTFRAGGRARLMVLPRTEEAVRRAVTLARENAIDYYIMGNGSNLLVRDEGFNGVIIKLGAGLDAVAVAGECVTAGAGASLTRIANEAMNAGLSGLEFASGIPGSFGGAVCMNAGAYDGEIKDVLTDAEVLTADGRRERLTNAELGFSYRDSAVQRKGMVVLRGSMRLTPGDTQTIRERARRMNDSRREKQPLEYPSAGSTFKRPPGNYAGKLIMDCGLAGAAIGGARVSEKHCGFIINTGGASAGDIIALIAHVRAVVREATGIELEPEVKIL